ncbi:MAG: 1-acyl-sn-glycerol-3-phosphate acyltransferase [Acidobacteria bacterium]|nr:1-acyl-sn-glycerol-3-phosphate acyltransferase [Acidobacteriota bacterium]
MILSQEAGPVESADPRQDQPATGERPSPRPFLRPLLTWAWGAPALVLACCLGFLLWPFAGGRSAFWWIAPHYVRLAAWGFGIRRRLAGWEGLPEGIRLGRQAAVFVGNHCSLFDPPLLISTLPGRPVFVAKRELAWVPFLGWAIHMAGFIFIDRLNLGRATASLQAAARKVREGQSILAFPEGTRSRDGSVLPFKRGIFALARKAGVPVIPFAIHGGPAILPRGTWRVAGGPYLIQVGQPLDLGPEATAEDLRRAAEEKVAQLLKEPAPLDSCVNADRRSP